jgi:hypothetical protein
MKFILQISKNQTIADKNICFFRNDCGCKIFKSSKFSDKG